MDTVRRIVETVWEPKAAVTQAVGAAAELKTMLESTVRLKLKAQLKFNEHAVNSAADKAMEDGRKTELGGSY